MLKRGLIAGAIVALCCMPFRCLAENEGPGSSDWSNLVHQENSIVSSVLYIPYMVFQIPVRIVDAIINPKPTSQATMPPQAHTAKTPLR
jgi:hypothetical protein